MGMTHLGFQNPGKMSLFFFFLFLFEVNLLEKNQTCFIWQHCYNRHFIFAGHCGNVEGLQLTVQSTSPLIAPNSHLHKLYSPGIPGSLTACLSFPESMPLLCHSSSVENIFIFWANRSQCASESLGDFVQTQLVGPTPRVSNVVGLGGQVVRICTSNTFPHDANLGTTLRRLLLSGAF